MTSLSRPHNKAILNDLETPSSRPDLEVAEPLASPAMDHGLPRPPMIRNFRWALFGNVTYAGCQWGILVVLAKLGSATIVGQFALALAVVTPIAALCNLQLRYILCTDAREQHPFSDYLTLRALTTAFSLVAIPIAAATSSTTRHLIPLVLLLACSRSVESFSDVTYGLLQRHERMDRIAISLATRGILQLVVLFVIIRTTSSIVVGTGGLLAVSLAILFLYDRRSISLVLGNRKETLRNRWSLALRNRLPLLKSLFWMGLPLGAVTGLDALMGNLPRYVIAASLGERQLGIFAVLYYLTVAGAQITGAMVDSASPRLAAWYASGDVVAFQRLLGRMLVIAFGVGGFMFVVAVLAGRPLLALVYLPEYARHSATLVWLMAACMFMFGGSVLGESLTAMRWFCIQVPLRVPKLIIAYATCVFLVPRYGLTGAAMAVVVSSVVSFGMTAILVLLAISRKRSSVLLPAVCGLDGVAVSPTEAEGPC